MHEPIHPEPILETTGLSALEQRQQLLSHHVRMVARKLSHALFVFGAQGGLGKSRTVLKTLEAEGVEPVLINSHITPLALYSMLYQYREDFVIFADDVDSIFGSMAHLGLLRSALWGTPRVVTYGSSQLPSELPSRFETTSRFIFAANVIPKRNDAFKAVLSRCDIFELSATNEEVLELMRCISAKGFRDLTPDDCQQVIDYIGENSDDRQISVRLLAPSLRKLQYARAEGLDWRTLVKSQLQTLGRKQLATRRLDTKSNDRRILEEAITKYPDSTQEQQSYWCSKTGKSRASFYRTLSRHNDDYRSRQFGSSGSHSSSKLRYFLKMSVSKSVTAHRGHRSDQGAVWQEVARQQSALGASSPSGAMSDTFQAYEGKMTEFKEKMGYVDGASGMAVAVGKKIVAVDLFDKVTTCRKVWDRLLTGYVLDALEAEAEQGQAETADVERLLGTANALPWQQADPVGEGEEYRANQGEEVHASALTLHDAPVHVSVVVAG